MPENQIWFYLWEVPAHFYSCFQSGEWSHAHTHTHTLETRSNSLVCTHAECLSSTVVLWFSVLEWGGDVIVPLGFLGWGHSGATQPWSHLSFLPSCPPLLVTPKEETGGGVLNATFLLRAFFFYTEVYPLSSHSHLDWIEKL